MLLPWNVMHVALARVPMSMEVHKHQEMTQSQYPEARATALLQLEYCIHRWRTWFQYCPMHLVAIGEEHMNWHELV